MAGQIWSRLERALEQDEQYEVYTPTLVAAVRGTSFGTEVRNGVEKFIVGEGSVEVWRGDAADEVQLVTAGNTAELAAGEIVVRPTTAAERDAWYEEHMADDWEHGGSDTLEVTKVHRDGFWFGNPGQVTIEGRGFNQLRSVLVDSEPFPFIIESDRTLRVPWSQLLRVSSESSVVIYYEGGETTPDTVYTGSYDDAMRNLIPFY